MSNRTNKKSPGNRGEIKEKELEMSLRSIWLGRRFLNRTFSIQKDDPIVDVEEIRELLNEDIKEGDDE